jgi:hypothetical protein
MPGLRAVRAPCCVESSAATVGCDEFLFGHTLQPPLVECVAQRGECIEDTVGISTFREHLVEHAAKLISRSSQLRAP